MLTNTYYFDHFSNRTNKLWTVQSEILGQVERIQAAYSGENCIFKVHTRKFFILALDYS